MSTPSKLIEIEVRSGNFQQGFAVVVRIGESGKRHTVDVPGHFPAAPELPELFDRWQSVYRKSGGMRLDFPPQTSNVSYWDACDSATRALRDRLEEWFEHRSMRNIREHIIEEVRKSEPARLILKTQDADLRRLPWHLWELTDRRPKLEIILSGAPTPARRSLRTPVRILAILGSSEGIDTEADREMLEDLPGAIVTFLVKPTRQALSDQLFAQPWDILFFAGHSKSATNLETGAILINDHDQLSLKEVKHAVRKAGENGLQLAIFNSCDGLGLAQEMAELRVPRIIVMREPVPDAIAQNFLKYFLQSFSKGERFFLAVRNAREQLHALENEYMCASWLPVICQSADPPELKYPRIQYPKWMWQRKTRVMAASAIALITFALGATAIRREMMLEGRMSTGEDLLIKSETSVNKEAGIRAYQSGNFAQAIAAFEAARQENQDDPETLIYLNNARIGNQPAEEIAVVAPVKDLDIAKQLLKGAAQKQSEINANGGVHGTSIKIRIVNDDNEKEVALGLADRLVSMSSIKAVIGHNASSVSLAASKIYQPGKLVMISPTSIDDSLTSPATELATQQTFIFRTILDATTMMNALVDYATTKYNINVDNAKIAICTDTKFGEKSSVKALEDRLTKRRAFRVANCDLGKPLTLAQAEQLIQEALQNRAKALFLAPYFPKNNNSDPANDATINLAKASQGKLPLLANFTPQGPRLITYGDAFNGMVIPSAFHPDLMPDRKFADALSQYWGEKAYCQGKLTARTALTYDALQVLVEGLKSSDRTREGIQKAISSDSFQTQGMTGNVQFQASGNRVVGQATLATLIQVQKINGFYCYGLVDNIAAHLSLGEKVLMSTNTNPDKQAGTKAFLQRDYATAIAKFQASLARNPNDPETRIYLNNAKAASRSDSLRIATGVPINMKNTSPEIAQEILRGVAQAQEEINQSGGIKGKLLQVQIASDNNDPELTGAIAGKLAEDAQILAVVGHNASEASIAGAPIYNEAQLVMITPTSFSDRLPLDDAGYIFRMLPGMNSMAQRLAKTVFAQDPKAVVAICSSAEDNREFRDKFTNEFRQVSGRSPFSSCDFSAANFQPEDAVNEALQKGANTLLLAPNVARIPSAIAVANANRNRLKLISSPTLCNGDTLQLGKATVNGLQVAVPWHPDTVTGKPFAKKAADLWKVRIDCWREAMAYDATMAITQGLRKAPTRTGLREVLKSDFQMQGASGSVQFARSGTRLLNPEVERLAQVEADASAPSGYRFALP
jgi:branched-chain amino acid transport system substrate-binding protein